MSGRWTVRGDRPADHDWNCWCPQCVTHLQVVDPHRPERPEVTYGGWCPQHGDILDTGAGCPHCGPSGGAA